MKNVVTYIKMISLLLLVPMYMACEEMEDPPLETEYGPKETRSFGDETALVQELRFSSGKFLLVGDLRRPAFGEQHPAVIMVHGSGEATRHGAVWFDPLIEIFLRNGYAVLSWDKPGSGESKGQLSGEYMITERAQILADAIMVLKENPSIDDAGIGLWGISQAGWVMPKAMEMNAGIAFMVVVSGGGEDGIDQGAYQVGQRVACNGGSAEEVQAIEKYWSQMNKAEEYEEYREAAQILLDIPGVFELTGLIMSDKKGWAPWPREIDAFFDPMDVIENTTIPVLAFFGEMDRYVDPVQGYDAYQAALQKAGNQDFQVEFIEHASHVMTYAETGCPGEQQGNQYMDEYLETMELWIQGR
jgi:pimeloyl-ACP methyl ester carboxylesterase